MKYKLLKVFITIGLIMAGILIKILINLLNIDLHLPLINNLWWIIPVLTFLIIWISPILLGEE